MKMISNRFEMMDNPEERGWIQDPGVTGAQLCAWVKVLHFNFDDGCVRVQYTNIHTFLWF